MKATVLSTKMSTVEKERK